MNFSFQRDLKDQIFSTQIVCTSLGDGTLTADQEQALIDDFGPVTVEVGGTYTGTYKVDAGNVVEDTVATTPNITFVVNNAKINLAQGVTIPFVADAKKISADELAKHASDTFVNAPLKLAEAKIYIFEKTIEKKITDTLTAFKNQKTPFQNNTPSDFQA